MIVASPSATAADPAAADPEVGKLSGSTSMTRTFAWMPDGHTLLTGEENGAIFIRDIDQRAEPKRLDGHRQSVSALVVDPAAPRFFSASHDGTVIAWDANSGEKIATWKFDKPVLGLAISPKAGIAAVALKANLVKIVSLADGHELRALDESGPHLAWDGPVLFLDDGQSVVTTGERFTGSAETAKLVAEKKIAPDAGRTRFTGIWNATTGALLAHMPTVGWEYPKQYYYTAKRDRLAALCVGNGAQITEWSVSDIAKTLTSPAPIELQPVSRRFIPHPFSQTAVIEPKASLILTNAEYFNKYRSRLWNLQTGRLLFDFDPFFGYIGDGVITPDGKRAIVDRGLTSVAGPKGQLSILDLTQRTKDEVWSVATNDVLSLQGSGPVLCASDGSENIRIWNRETGQELLCRTKVPTAPRIYLGKEPIAFLGQPSLQLLNLKSGATKAAPESSLQSLWPVFEVARDGKFILIGNSSPSFDSNTVGALVARTLPPQVGRYVPAQPRKISALRLFDPELHQIGAGFDAHLDRGLSGAALSPGSARVVSIDGDGVARLFDAKTQHLLAETPASTPPAKFVCVNDEGIVVTVTEQGRFQVFRGAERIGEAMAPPDTKLIAGMIIAPDGKAIATIEEVATEIPGFGYNQQPHLRIRALPRLEILREFTGSLVAAGGLAFPDSETLVSWHQDGTVRVWKWKQ